MKSLFSLNCYYYNYKFSVIRKINLESQRKRVHSGGKNYISSVHESCICDLSGILLTGMSLFSWSLNNFIAQTEFLLKLSILKIIFNIYMHMVSSQCQKMWMSAIAWLEIQSPWNSSLKTMVVRGASVLF